MKPAGWAAAQEADLGGLVTLQPFLKGRPSLQVPYLAPKHSREAEGPMSICTARLEALLTQSEQQLRKARRQQAVVRPPPRVGLWPGSCPFICHQ